MTKPTRLRKQRNSKSIKDMYTLLDRFSDIVYVQKHSKEYAIQKLNEVQNKLSETQDKNLKVTLSIGIAVCLDDGDNFYELFKAADKALYKAKNSGKDCVCFV